MTHGGANADERKISDTGNTKWVSAADSLYGTANQIPQKTLKSKQQN
jgi:hypothetical protein